MKVYVGITDWNWYDFLRTQDAEEVNFWKPGGQPFKALDEGDLFLFKMKAARGGLIAGGGFFVGASTTTIDWAWRAFGVENGVNNLAQLSDAIWKYKNACAEIKGINAEITNVILTDTFYFEDKDWFAIPFPWGRGIVQGKTYEGQEAAALVSEVQQRLSAASLASDDTQSIPQAPGGFVLTTAKHRPGQGAFRTFVADAYHRRCAVTGEHTVPVLEAAHVKAFSAGGPNAVNNGILLRSDLHTLFDAGYLTIDNDMRVVVSRRLHDDYGNGKDYYPLHGKRLTVLPDKKQFRPAKEFLDWHHEQVFLG